MNLNPRSASLSKVVCRLAAPLSALLVLQGSLSGQEAIDEQTVVLSPFEVQADSDVGYQATASLVGSRTNTSLRDISNPIDVITQELMEDLAILDIQDLASVASGTEVNAAGALNPDGQEREIWNYNYMQIRGFRVSTSTRNFMTLGTGFEAYNSERVAFSKGPNAVLFGTGSPGGTNNYMTKKPMFKTDFNTVQLRTDSFGSVRGSADFNRSIGEKAAVRLNVLKEAREFYREPSSHDLEGAHLVFSYRPFPNTTLTVGYEWLDSERVSPKGVFARDRVTPYLQAGAPVIAEVRGRNVRVAGTTDFVPRQTLGLSTITGTRYTMIGDGLFDLKNTANTLPYTVNGFNNVSVLDPVPGDISISGPNGINYTESEIGEIMLTHSFTDDLSLEVAYGTSDIETRGGHAVSSDLYIDPMQTGSISGTQQGSYYVESNPFIIDRLNDFENLRATMSYELDLTRANKWLGRHRFATMYETLETNSVRDGNRFVVTGDPNGPIDPQSYGRNGFRDGKARFWVRQYLDFENGPVTNVDFRDIYFSDGYTVGGYTIEKKRVVPWVQQRTRGERDTLLGVWQGFWWDDRVVTTVGYRDDSTDDYSAAFSGFDPVTGERVPNALEPGAPEGTIDPRFALLNDTPTSSSGISRNYGLVFHANDWLSFTANQATNYSPPTSSRDIYGNFIGGSSGESEDFGVRLNLFDGKLYMDVLRFETSELNSLQRGGQVNMPSGALRNIDEILLDNGAISQLVLGTGGDFTTADTIATGEEIILVATPTPQWNLRLTASRVENKFSNLGEDVKAFVDANLSTWKSYDQSWTTNSGTEPLSTYIETVETEMALLRAREDVVKFPASEYIARLTSKYKFDSTGPLKGFAVGGNLSWKSGPTIGYFKTDNGAFDVEQSFKGDSQTFLDLFFTYNKRLSEKLQLRLQLNIKNVFDETDPWPVEAINATSDPNSDWVVTRYRPIDGRAFILTTELRF